MRKIIIGILGLGLVGGLGLGLASAADTSQPAAGGAAPAAGDAAPAAGDAAAPAAGAAGECCKPGDTTPPLDLIKATPIGGLHNPYNDQIDAMAEEGHKKYLSYSCNGCHGGGGGGGMCPPLTNDSWVYGASDDVLFRLIALGSDDLKKLGYKRIKQEIVVGPMPPFGSIIKTSDEMWKVIAFLRAKNPSSLKRAGEPTQDLSGGPQ
ncbi:MAG: c-type cytochrome [Methyloceanibacter sp.]|uniref:c-type cytochrome n=1 Tax=Methyloceanibacter sp. TaxID=1965321 RepID=UPI003D9AFE8D